MNTLTAVERARLVHMFVDAASSSEHGDGFLGAQVIGREIVAFVINEASSFTGTFGEFPVRSVVVGDLEETSAANE